MTPSHPSPTPSKPPVQETDWGMPVFPFPFPPPQSPMGCGDWGGGTGGLGWGNWGTGMGSGLLTKNPHSSPPV
jgi:hypothetical protein